MLEIRGANPNYIHVRKDIVVMDDVQTVFFEEVTPLMVACQYGAEDVVKLLFNHPSTDVNLVGCGYTDLEIYGHYTAYDFTLKYKQPQVAALLRVRGVLPAS